MTQVALSSSFDITSSHLVAQPQLFLSVFQGVQGTGAAVPQSLHLTRLILKCLAGPNQSFQLVLGCATHTDKLKYI